MTPDQLAALRARLGLSAKSLGDILQLGEDSGRVVRHLEAGTRPIRGQTRILLEMLEAGELPKRYMVEPPRRGRKPKDAE